MANSPAYSHAIIKEGTPVFISGQVAQDAAGKVVGEGDVEAQVEQVFKNLRTVVTACGGTMDDIVKLTVYALDRNSRPALGRARAKYWSAGEMPASTFVLVAGLAAPEFLVEVEAVAVIA
jgi:enamine deaminase RidA (YjgF/YER057c/UK114 family)